MLKKSFLVLVGIIVFAIALLGASIRPLSAAPLAQATSTPEATGTVETGATETTGTVTTGATETTGTVTTGATTTTGTATTDATTTTGTTGTATTGGNTGQPSQLPQTGGEDASLPLASLIVLLFLGGITALTLARRNGTGR